MSFRPIRFRSRFFAAVRPSFGQAPAHAAEIHRDLLGLSDFVPAICEDGKFGDGIWMNIQKVIENGNL